MTGVLAATVVGLCATPALAASRNIDGPIRQAEKFTYRDQGGLETQCRNARGRITSSSPIKASAPGTFGGRQWRYRVVCQIRG